MRVFRVAMRFFFTYAFLTACTSRAVITESQFDVAGDGNPNPDGSGDVSDTVDGGLPPSCQCGESERCVAEVCLPAQCANEVCAENQVCVNDVCADAQCVNHACVDGEYCSSGQCFALERVGNPFLDKGAYVRNSWDMQLFDGRIYLGYGNSSNEGPAPGPGALSIWSYNPATNQFRSEFAVQEDQVDRFRVLNGVLHVPGHDPKEGWELGNFYRLEATGWKKYRTIPNGVHTYDLAYFQGKMFAALGTASQSQMSVVMSEDNGLTWQPVIHFAQRVYGLFEWAGTLYAMASVPNFANAEWNYLFRYDPSRPVDDRFVQIGIPGSKIIPGAPWLQPGFPQWPQQHWLQRPTVFKSQLVYFAAYFVNDHQWDPIALYVAPSWEEGRQVTLPEPNAKPYDFLVRADTLYLLAAAKQTDGSYINLIYSTSDLTHWSELFRFPAVTFARSFERVENDFYFGLGCNVDVLPQATGDILRLRLTGPAAQQ